MKGVGVAGVLLLLAATAQAEYRAFELEVFDRTTNRSSIVTTTFAPDDYVATHGGPDRTGVIIRASWICYGDTSNGQKVCPIPQAVNPAFQPGDRVQVMLPQHLTDQWVGTIENSFFRPELRSNVYGVRFSERGGIYTRYYEAHLQKAP